MAAGASRNRTVILSLVALVVLAAGSCVLWVVWWLLADLLSGSPHPPARIGIAEAANRARHDERPREPREAA